LKGRPAALVPAAVVDAAVLVVVDRAGAAKQRITVII
jgi:hypothetical protein